MPKKIGSREEVYKGLAIQTSGGLRKENIICKTIRKKEVYVSKRLSELMKVKNNLDFKIETQNVNLYKRDQ